MKIAILPDFLEENWPSMDLASDMLMSGLARRADIEVECVRPPYRKRATRVPLLRSSGLAANVDRLLNRMVDFPRHARSRCNAADVFHVVDHSYSQVVFALPAERTGVFCHDLDTFRCVLHPERDRRPWWFRRMAGRILDGFRKAAVVFHTTDTIRGQILDEKLIDESRLVKAPYGMSEEFRPGSDSDALPAIVRNRLGRGPMLLHVGSCIPRKRIDVLLDVLARVRRLLPDAWLVQAGGEWTTEQSEQIERLGVADGIVRTGRLQRPAIAELYRRAAVVLMPSEAEGFGLPTAEALACGAIVLASDIPVFREVGGDAAVYAPLANVDAWCEIVAGLLARPSAAPDLSVRLERARRFTWDAHVSAIVGAYEKLIK